MGDEWPGCELMSHWLDDYLESGWTDVRTD